ncbi:hypothetical protein F5X98DRAFT_35346 [Xylaria grammica]|nr:hypothetical protein F5X98DRAFT_35346 [Xylaria grammica]
MRQVTRAELASSAVSHARRKLALARQPQNAKTRVRNIEASRKFTCLLVLTIPTSQSRRRPRISRSSHARAVQLPAIRTTKQCDHLSFGWRRLYKLPCRIPSVGREACHLRYLRVHSRSLVRNHEDGTIFGFSEAGRLRREGI